MFSCNLAGSVLRLTVDNLKSKEKERDAKKILSQELNCCLFCEDNIFMTNIAISNQICQVDYCFGVNVILTENLCVQRIWKSGHPAEVDVFLDGLNRQLERQDTLFVSSPDSSMEPKVVSIR